MVLTHFLVLALTLVMVLTYVMLLAFTLVMVLTHMMVLTHVAGAPGRRRPIENSLEAYELAWTSGLKLCECDVAVSRDGALVLGHDADYSRLALQVSNTPRNTHG